MTFLLDVNVLITLLDPMHVSHETAHHWFSGDAGRSWATCPITENAVVRIVGHNRYPNSPGSPTAVAGLLRLLRKRPGHVFWADDVSLLDPTWFQPDYMLNHGQVTDA